MPAIRKCCALKGSRLALFTLIALAIAVAIGSPGIAQQSQISISAPGQPAGSSIVVPSGARLTVDVVSHPGDRIGRALRVQSPLPQPDGWVTNLARTVTPELNDGSNAHAFVRRVYFDADKTTSFEWTTLGLAPGDYRLVGLFYDEVGDVLTDSQGGALFLSSNVITIAEGLSDDLLPPSSSQATISALVEAIESEMTGASPAVVRLYDMSGQPLSATASATTGQPVALAINTSGMADLDNRVTLDLALMTGGGEFPWLEVYPAAAWVAAGEAVAASTIQQQAGPVLVQFFHLPPDLLSVDLSGTLRATATFTHWDEGLLPLPPGTEPSDPSGPTVGGAASTLLTLLDSPAGTVPVSSGEVLESFDVRIVFPDLGLGSTRYAAFAEDVEDYFHFATKEWFTLEVTMEEVPLADLPIDYLDWWNGLAHDPTRALDPGDQGDLELIRQIYATENRFEVAAELEALRPTRSAGEDLTVYMTWATSSGSGAGQSDVEIQTAFRQPLFSIDYQRSGLWGRPTVHAPSTVWDTSNDRRLATSITTHEIAHVAWRFEHDLAVGHVGSYVLRRSSDQTSSGGLDNRILSYLNESSALEAIGWRDTLMSLSRNRFLPEIRMADDQLSAVLELYEPATGPCPEAVDGYSFLGAFGQRHFFLSDDKRTWPVARSRALAAGGDLASIHSATQDSWLAGQLASSGTMAFIGLNDEGEEGILRWSNGDAVTYDNSSGNSESRDYAVANFWGGSWSFDSELVWRHAVLELACEPAEPSCPESLSGFTSLGEFDGNEYFLSDQKAPWTEQLALAQSVDASPVVVDSPAKNRFILDNTSESVWLGLTDSATEGTFVWVDGTPLSFENFASCCSTNSESHDYASLNFWDGKWAVESNGVYRRVVVEVACEP